MSRNWGNNRYLPLRNEDVDQVVLGVVVNETALVVFQVDDLPFVQLHQVEQIRHDFLRGHIVAVISTTLLLPQVLVDLEVDALPGTIGNYHLNQLGELVVSKWNVDCIMGSVLRDEVKKPLQLLPLPCWQVVGAPHFIRPFRP